jgi:hypothetical protein
MGMMMMCFCLLKVLTVVVSVSANHGIDEEVEIGQRAE